ncbi:MAG: hypothetical protein EBY80_01535 [Actinobacteria bacterium]|nr:hypothetical protein [Actinomycetota bacterium]
MLIQLILQSLVLVFEFAVVGHAPPSVFDRTSNHARGFLDGMEDPSEDVASPTDDAISLLVESDQQDRGQGEQCHRPSSAHRVNRH